MDNGKPNYDIHELADKWRKGTITPEEKDYYEKWFGNFNDSETTLTGDTSSSAEEIRDRMFIRLKQRMVEPARIKRLGVYRITAAASIILAIAFGSYLLFHRPVQQSMLTTKQDIAPGSNKATLTLTDGRTIVLTNARNGKLVEQGRMTVTKTSEGAIAYNEDSAHASQAPAAMVYNTLTTPRGGKYDLTLADGTKVWLDAASSITYPVAFAGHDRSVTITGQAYFEVAHNATQPFRVSANNQVIEVLGTHFNVNAYADEPVVKTTLLEGSVKISHDKATALLKPGEQAVVRPASSGIIVNTVDTEEATSWKNGYFFFDHEGIESVMRKVSRWYDLDIIFPKNQQITENYLGSITRYDNVSKVLAMLEFTGKVRFKLEGKQITVLKK